SHRAEVFCLDTGWPEIAAAPTTNPQRWTTAGHLAYVIYTSGSTGTPKGVMIEHAAICNHMYWMQRVFPLTEQDSLLQKTPFSFDASVWEFFAPLCTGAKLVMARPGGHADVSYMVATINQMNITVLQLVPTLLSHLLEEPDFWTCTSLRQVFSGGEPLSPMTVCTFAEHMQADLYNLYGPTEASIDTTIWHCQRQDNENAIPIGRPISNVQTYVLDEALRPLPIGVAGELYIGGVGVARGYLHRPELTAERFVPDPFSPLPGARLYRTGDQARFRPDGAIEFLGRIDQQVKIRGFRIEPGEIETVLAQHPGVQECVVVARQGIADGHQLVAYVVAGPGQSVTSAALHGYLSTKLPAYMLPAFFVILLAFPLLPNGKIDRRALPEPARMPVHEFGVDTRSRTPTEEILLGIWQHLLHLEHLGPASEFFACGGHSLLATRLIARIRQAFQVELPLQAIFTTPVLEELARVIDTARQQGITALPPIEARQSETPPLSFGQERLWFLDQLTPGDTSYHVPLGFRLCGTLEVEVLAASLNALLQRHAILRTTFAEREGQPIQVIAPSLVVPLQRLDLRAWPVEEREAVLQQRLQEEIAQPFDLERGPLQRYLLLRMSEEEHVLFLLWHHSISDGWSAGIFLRELSALYTAGCAGEVPDLPPLTVHYADYALWQREQTEEFARQLAYWREHLAGAPPLLELPTDRPRPGVQTFVGTSASFQIPVELVRGVRQVSQREQATLYMTLLAAFQVVLARYSGQRDIVVGSPIAGRTRVELEGMIGFLVNTLALRVQLADNPSFGEVVQRVREAALQAYAHQDVPFEQVVQALQPERNLSHSPLFQVMFMLQNDQQTAFSLPAITSTPLPIASPIAKFDLTMTLMEEGEIIQGELEYNTDLFDEVTMRRLAGHYLHLLDEVVRDASQPVLDIPLLTAGEQRQLRDWNATEADFPGDRCLQDLFEEQAARTPQAVAVLFEGQQLRYEELNARANQVAHALQARGVGADTLVGLCVERSLEMIIGILGILKAGGAYLPLDPDYPAERLAYMLTHTRATLLLTQQHLVERLPNHQAEVLCLDTAWPQFAALPTTNPVSSAVPDHLAYVIYTSGSTGTPKGVMI
ncbi:MAG TPA: amino acid adenylation domain-containing protein, partial [Ktedonobacteraceae bacterium]|nr:amino acid adenylation domain-containing protein [Ktedonobacteraceae bacterium]